MADNIEINPFVIPKGTGLNEIAQGHPNDYGFTITTNAAEVNKELEKMISLLERIKEFDINIHTTPVINIEFKGPLQQNNGVKESAAQADNAVAALTTAINSISQGIYTADQKAS